jgi:nifR3 family TIM-barrel protein
MPYLYRPVTIGTVTLSGNLFLAPVAGYTDRVFRSICVEEGASLTFTELVSSEALIRGGGIVKTGALNGRTAILMRRAANEKHYAIQLFGSDPAVMYEAARIALRMGSAFLDINAGCPVPKVTKTGAGSALMKTPANLGRCVAAVVKACREYGETEVPVTVKMRSGWDAASLNYLECAGIAVEAGASMISLHPRTRAQVYSGKSDWRHIAALVAAAPVPVTGSGDLYTPEDAARMLEETACAAVMFARGALGNPFIFSSTRALLETGAYTPADEARRVETALRQTELLSLDIGERGACLEMRKTFCAYTKGLRGGAAMRNALVHAETIEDYHRILGSGHN